MKNFIDLYNLLINGNITEYKTKLRNMKKEKLVKYVFWAIDNNISLDNLKLEYLYK